VAYEVLRVAPSLPLSQLHSDKIAELQREVFQTATELVGTFEEMLDSWLDTPGVAPTHLLLLPLTFLLHCILAVSCGLMSRYRWRWGDDGSYYGK
jgi:hypothetical protein